MAEADEPLIVVLGPFAGGTSAVAVVLHRLGVYMGCRFFWAFRAPHETWEDGPLTDLARKAFAMPDTALQMDPDRFEARLREWADQHRAAARRAGQPPGVKQPLLCLAVDTLRTVWGPIRPVVVDRPFDDVVASLNRLGWWDDEQHRAEATAKLIAERDRALGDTIPVRVDFAKLRAEPEPTIRRLADDLGLTVTEEQLAAAVAEIVQPGDVHDADPYGVELLLGRIARDPDDVDSVHILAQCYHAMDDAANTRTWYTRWLEAGEGTAEERYTAKYRIAEAMDNLDEPWDDVQEAYLQAWESRPTRAEPLFEIAWHCRGAQLWQRGHLFAQWAGAIPRPLDDFVELPDIYAWRCIDEQAVCASQLGLHTEAFTLFRRLLARLDIPAHERQRMAKNRDFSVPTMLEAALPYPEALAGRLTAGSGDAEVTVTLVAENRRDTELTLNSFLNCCTDIDRVGRFLIVNAGLSRIDRVKLASLYPFVEFTDFKPAAGAALFTQIREQVAGRFWFHLGQGWRFFAPEALVTRLCAVLEAEPQVFEVGVNFTDAVEPISSCATEEASRHAPGAGRYVLTDDLLVGPAMFDTTRLDRTGGIDSADPDPVGALAHRAAAAGLRTATLDEVLVG